MNQPSSAGDLELQAGPQWTRARDEGPRILIVDDREDNAMLLSRLLGAMGYRHVRMVFDSRLAMHSIVGFRPELVFLDIQMPHVNGFEILEAVRKYGGDLNALPIIVTSADTSPEIRTKAMSLGANDIFQSFDGAELADLVAKYLGTSMERRVG